VEVTPADMCSAMINLMTVKDEEGNYGLIGEGNKRWFKI
jgi:hypothetical protein